MKWFFVVFNNSPSSALPNAQEQVNEQSNASSNLPNSEQGVVENENSNNIPTQDIPIQNEVPVTIANDVPLEANSPKSQPEINEQTALPSFPSDTLNDLLPPTNVQHVQPVNPTIQPVAVSNPYPQSPISSNPVSPFQPNQPANGYYPGSFAGSQASFPAPNYSNNPYLQGLLPGGGNQQASVPVQPPPQNAIPAISPPQNAVPLPPAVVIPPQNAVPVPHPPQNAVHVPPQNLPNIPANSPTISNNNPFIQNQVPPQNQASGVSNNNPYLQNLNPSAIPSQNPQVGGVTNQNSNPFFPSVPISQAPTQSYPTPCTNIPSNTQYFNPSQGTTFQPVATSKS